MIHSADLYPLAKKRIIPEHWKSPRLPMPMDGILTTLRSLLRPKIGLRQISHYHKDLTPTSFQMRTTLR